jgi:SAM-dependent methyltransferase
MTTRWKGGSGDDYDRRWSELAAQGKDVHGEADFVASLDPRPRSVLDAGCGTGRVAIELGRRGFDVVGVDVDDAMLAAARRKAPSLPWVTADLSSLDLGGRRFDCIVMAGNVLIFVASGTEAAVVARCACHLEDGGALVAGFQLQPAGYGLDAYDADCAAAGLTLAERFATWDRDPYQPGGGYAVSVHRR